MSAIEFRKILCPIDFSAPSEFGAIAALDLAGRLGGAVHVVHAVEQPGMPGSKLRQLKRREADEKMKHFVDERVAELRVMAGAPDAELTTEVVPGEPLEVVLAMVKERAFDLVVVASHARSGLERFMIGSVTQELIARCSCPVLVVRSIVSA